MHGQCNARTMASFPAAEHHHPLTSTKLYYFGNNSTWVWTTCPGLLHSCTPTGSGTHDRLTASPMPNLLCHHTTWTMV